MTIKEMRNLVNSRLKNTDEDCEFVISLDTYQQPQHMIAIGLHCCPDVGSKRVVLYQKGIHADD